VLAQQLGVAGEVAGLADHHRGMPNWMIAPVHIMQGDRDV
jgi:hypothetical protein